MESLTYPEYFSGGFHFRTKTCIHIMELFKGKDRHLDGHMVHSPVQACPVSEIPELFACHYLRCKIHQRYPCYFADIRHCPAGPGIHFNDIDFIVVQNVLDVYHAYNIQCFCQPFSIIHYPVRLRLAE